MTHLEEELLQALDLATAIADAIVEGRHSAAVVNWRVCRDEWQAVIEKALVRKAQQELLS